MTLKCEVHANGSVLTSRQELHDEVEVPLVLEAVEHLDHPGAVRLHQNISLCPDMGDLQGDRRQRETPTKCGSRFHGVSLTFTRSALPTCSFSSMSAFLKIFMA